VESFTLKSEKSSSGTGKKGFVFTTYREAKLKQCGDDD